MLKNSWKLQEITGLEMAEMAFKKTGNDWILLEMVGTAGNGWK